MISLLPVLAWAPPVCFALHVTEEFFRPGGFIAWYHRYRPRYTEDTAPHYLKVNAIGLLAALAVSVTVSATGDNWTALLILTGILASNALFTHLWGAIKTRSYSPGMVTGLLLYVPLAVLTWTAVATSGKEGTASLLLAAAISPLLELYFARKPANHTVDASSRTGAH